MSFASRTKKELTLIEESDCCQRTELEALITANGRLKTIGGRPVLDIETENVAIARRIYTLIKAALTVHPEVVVRKKMRLKKNNVYAIRLSTHPLELLQQLGWNRLPSPGAVEQSVPVLDKRRKRCCQRAYLRGVFLAGGSVNDPGSNSYHLEISASTKALGEILIKMTDAYELHAKLIQRKRGYVLYLKEGEKIVDFMSIIGAHQALLKFEDVRILKGMRNQVNRLVNCETANLNKTIGAAVRQLEVIRFIDEHMGIQNLPNHLREVAELRQKYPEVNLQELTARLGNKVSKSGLNHRFRKLEQIAEQLGK
ncbi:DNA-binding protein WhiA [Alicyclobacillus sp. SO9]|uniref:DNA-binding protein WhiA n=1 Tax=Alicyclobacillus sp. SO9 TaxID=2665646 RepID=UPI0018E85627|nr:DNA-binding protein WhiA [Alicyclobacillus sp. SO9]QQE79469.1 DNA-binding protein WhiA [Alicyclobacillus sp. SO9]